jgi:hypothetical protein
MSYPKTTRIKAGYELYQKRGTVNILFYDNTMVQAEVKNSTGGTELVSCVLSYFRCSCKDWTNRWQLIPGGYLCKHCHALLFEIGYRKANNLKMVD